MCGISGFYSPDSEIPLDKYYSAHSLLRHRGPDDEGFAVLKNSKICPAKGNDTIEYYQNMPDICSYQSSRMVLGHRRLSILDLTWRGHQPMSSEDGRYWLVYNGEIYNYLELKSELEALGCSFFGTSDSEVFLKAYVQWGEDCFNKFNGMWAAALFDTSTGTLILTRDRFGIKPLYYYLGDNILYFGSEVKYLLPFVDTLEINEQIAADYIVSCHVDHVNATMFKDVFQLEPGHYAIFDGHSLKIEKYWNYNPSANPSIPYEDAVTELHQLLSRSIDLRMRSDVPVGSLLSGGLDSTTIVCDLHCRGKLEDNNIETFSAVFDEEKYSEKKYIEKTVEKIDCIPHYIYPDPSHIADEIKNILYFQEFPFRSLAVYSQYCIYRHIGKNTQIKVLLNGQGSDEIFGGYTSHYFSFIGECLRTGKIKTAISEAILFSKFRNQGIKDIGLFVGRILFPSLSDMILSFVHYHPKLLKKDVPTNKCLNHSENLFLQDLYCGLVFSPLREYLRYEDRNSMAFSVETRLPFMDFNVVEFGYSLPNDYKIENGVNKRILRTIASGSIPDDILNRTDKMGFVSPQEIWQKTLLKSYMDKIITKPNLEENLSFLNSEEVVRLYGEYLDGNMHDWSLFWRICCLYEWKKLWFDSGSDMVI